MSDLTPEEQSKRSTEDYELQLSFRQALAARVEGADEPTREVVRVLRQAAFAANAVTLAPAYVAATGENQYGLCIPNATILWVDIGQAVYAVRSQHLRESNHIRLVPDRKALIAVVKELLVAAAGDLAHAAAEAGNTLVCPDRKIPW
jgi:hypothetical protein